MKIKRLKKLLGYAPNVLLPRIVRNGWLSLRTRSFVSPGADVYHGSKVRIGRSCLIDACLIDGNGRGSVAVDIGDDCLIHRNTVVRAVGGSVKIGRGTSIQHFTSVYGLGNTTIGDNVLIASHCAIAVAQHNFGDGSVPIANQGTTDADTVIESNVWLGAHVVVFAGVTIGQGSVIGAGAVVNRNIPPGSIAVGVPAKVLRKREIDH